MTVIISHNTFDKMRLKREFNDLMSKYLKHDIPNLQYNSVKYICDNYKLKALMNLQMLGEGTISTYSITSNAELLNHLINVEFDYEFISSDLLRLTFSPILWIDIYFNKRLSEDEEFHICDMLEDDVMLNYKLTDESLKELSVIFNTMNDITIEYKEKFGTNINEDTHDKLYR